MAALLIPFCLDAASPAAAGPPSSAEKARAVLLAKGAERTASQMFDAMITSLQKSDNTMDAEFWTAVRKRLVPRELVDRLVPIYQREFSSEDLDAMLRFYQSPAGKRLSEQEPAIATESLQVALTWGEGVKKQVLADLAAKGKTPAPPTVNPSAQIHEHPGATADATARIRKLLLAMNGGRQGEQLVDALLASLRKSRPDIEPDFWPALRARIRTDELVELSVPIYQRHIPEADIDDLMRFYLSPAGRHLIEKQPAVAAASMQAGQEWATQLIEPVVNEIMAKQQQRDEHSAQAGGELRTAAERGDAKAQFSLGEAYERGKHGVPKSIVDAVAWYTKAANQGLARAQSRLGQIYSLGEPGLTKDPGVAAQWYRKAAEQGDLWSIRETGFAYLIGEGVPEDPAEAAKWLNKAALRGDTSSMVLLGGLYANGRGLPRDVAEAERWYRKAAEGKDRGAEYELGALLLQRADSASQTEGMKWLQAAADHGSDEAKKALSARHAATTQSRAGNPSGSATTAAPMDEVLLKSSAGPGKTADAVELHLRDAGLRGVIGLLAQATGLNLVLDARVHERITGDFSGPWDEVFEKLLKQSGLKHAVHGLIVAIGPDDSPVINISAPKDADDGEPVSLTLAAARLEDVVGAFRGLGLKFDLPEGALPGSVSVFVADVPVNPLVPLILESTGYSCEERDGIFKVRPLPEIGRFAAAAKAVLSRCQTPACDDLASLKLRATLTPLTKGSPTLSLFEFSEDRYQFMRAGEVFDGQQASVAEASPRKVIVTEKREGKEVPVTFRVDNVR